MAGRAPAHRLLDDEHTVSFLSIEPTTVGHALVVPRHRADQLQPPWHPVRVPDADLAAVQARVPDSSR